MSLRDVLHVVFKRKIQILVFFGVTVCTVAIASFTARPTYQATAQILVKIGREDMYVPTLPSGTSSPIVRVNRQEQINSEIQILKSEFLAEKVVESLGAAVIYEDLTETTETKSRGLLSSLFQSKNVEQSPVQSQRSRNRKAVMRLQKAITAEAVKNSNVINITFRHSDPEMTAKVVNTFVSVYLEYHLHVHKSPQSSGFFREQSQILKNKLEQAEEKLEAFKNEHNLTSLHEEQRLLLRQEAALRAALNETQSQEVETEKRLRQIRHQLNKTPKIIPLDEQVHHNPPILRALQERLAGLELKELELLTKYTDESRLVQSVRDQMLIVRKKLVEHEARRYGTTRTGVNPIYHTLQREFFQNEAELKALKAKKEAQHAQLVDHHKRLTRLNQIEPEFNRVQQEVDVDRQNYGLFLTKFEESRISDAMDAKKIANVSLIEPARPPLNPVSPKKFLNMALAVVLGGGGAFGLAFFSEYLMNDNLEKAEDVESHLHLPVLATIPELKG